MSNHLKATLMPTPDNHALETHSFFMHQLRKMQHRSSWLSARLPLLPVKTGQHFSKIITEQS